MSRFSPATLDISRRTVIRAAKIPSSCCYAAVMLYMQIGEWYSVGQAHAALAEISSGEERTAFLEKARSAWQTIGRQDLIESLEKQFPLDPSPAPAPK